MVPPGMDQQKKIEGQDTGRGTRPRFESAPTTAVKKQGVSGESSDGAAQQSRDIKIPKYEKDFRSKQLIKDAIMDNDFMKNIDSLQIRELVESMYSREIPAGKSQWQFYLFFGCGFVWKITD